jgi:hypothetical protein
MPTVYDDNVAKAEAALGKLNALETAAMRAGDIVTMNALQSDSNDLSLKLTQLRALQYQSDVGQIVALNNQLDGISNSVDLALRDVTKIASVLTGILAATRTLDALIAVAANAARI